jgi:hypothetical protein
MIVATLQISSHSASGGHVRLARNVATASFPCRRRRSVGFIQGIVCACALETTDNLRPRGTRAGATAPVPSSSPA